VDSARTNILAELASRIQLVESGRRPQGQLSLELGSVDGLLPEEGLPPGSLVELLSNTDGVGVWTLALFMGWHACGEGRTLVVVDPERCFYPPAAALKLGIDLARTIVIRPRSWPDAYVALEQSMRCSAVGAVIGRCDRLSFADCRRLQLAAEAGGGVGLLLRSEETRGAPSFAALRLRVTPLGEGRGTRVEGRGGKNQFHFSSLASHLSPLTPRPSFRVDVLRCRGSKTGRSLVLEVDDETGHVRLSAALAAATARAR